MSDLAATSKEEDSTSSGGNDRSDDDSFEDAHDSQQDVPIPTTRVERTDSEPSHGEVPGTPAYTMREQDAVPDELEVVPEGSRSRQSSTGESPSSSKSLPIPKTIIEKVDPEQPSHGEVPGTEAHAMRQADAEPDEVKSAPVAATSSLEGSPTSPLSRSQSSHSPMTVPPDSGHDESSKMEGDEEDEADDFDDFAEGSDNDDFGAFDDGDESVQETQQHIQVRPPGPVEVPPIFQFHGLKTPQDVRQASESFIKRTFPSLDTSPTFEAPPLPSTSFLNERSQSLWAQLVAPPPLQPPNWVRSRTRRLFLVSLGVPVDLDEILPASKQKKLILPSIDFEHERQSPQPNGSVSRLKQKNSSTASVNSTSNRPDRSKRKGPPSSPQFDVNAARLICLTTNEALHKYTPAELRAHKARLEEIKAKASEALEYWLIQRDSASGDKEAFEEVIANFVKHAKKSRT